MYVVTLPYEAYFFVSFLIHLQKLVAHDESRSATDVIKLAVCL